MPIGKPPENPFMHMLHLKKMKQPTYILTSFIIHMHLFFYFVFEKDSPLIINHLVANVYEQVKN